MPLFCALVLLTALFHVPAPAAAAPPAPLAQALAGRWEGTLQYRDYTTDNAVTLPTTVSVDAALRLAFTYDDGPGKTVRSSEQWTFDGTTLQMGAASAPLQVSNYRSNERGDLVLIAFGNGIENGVPVEVRQIVLRQGDTLQISRASRLPQQAWLLRHAYRLTVRR